MNLQITTGRYTGSGSATAVSVGFQPDLVIIKGNGAHPIFRIASNIGDDTAYLSINLGNLTGAITGLTATGFNIGTDGTVNTAATTYYWIAIKGYAAEQYFYTGKYAGNGSAGTNLTTTGISFTPNFVNIKRNNTITGQVRFDSEVGDLSGAFTGSHTTNIIQAFIANGFKLGSSTGTNASGGLYQFFSMKNLKGVFASGSYVGNGSIQSVSGIGFTPTVVFLKDITGANTGGMRIANMTTTTSYLVSNGNSQSTLITSLDSDGFSLGASASGNANGNTYAYFAMKSGNFNVPLNRHVL